MDDLRKLEPYLPDIRAAATEFGVPPAVLCGVCLRETLAGWATGYLPRGAHLGWGDNGHGFGLFQADDRSNAAWIESPEALTVLGQARKAAAKLVANRRLLAAAFPALPARLIERAAISAYNARLGAVAMQFVKAADPDAVTTPGPSGRPDYGADVLSRADRLARSFPHLFTPSAGDARKENPAP